MSVSINAEQLSKIAQGFDQPRLEEDIHIAYQVVADAIIGDVKNRFASDSFAALAPSTIARRGQAARPLEDTMELFNAAISNVVGTPYSDYDIDSDGLHMGVNKPGAEEAEQGSIHEPQREFMPQDEDYILRLVDESRAMERLADKIGNNIW